MAENGIPEDASAVSVMHIVGPSTFWVTKSPGNYITKEREKLNYLEEMLSLQSQRSFHGVNYIPKEGELIAVQHPVTGCWHRAEMEYMMYGAKGCAYRVFLVDHGVSIEVCTPAIRMLPVAWNSLEYQAFKVVLYGVLPTTVEMDYEDMKMKRKIASDWTPAAEKFVDILLEKSTKTWFVEKKNIKKKSYGDLFIEVADESLSLSKELCDKEYAVFSEELFEEALVMYNKQQEQQFCRTPSPQSSLCSDDSRKQNNSHKDGKSMQNDTEETFGNGMLIQKRKERLHDVHSKLGVANGEQMSGKFTEDSSLEASYESEKKTSSELLGLLDVINRPSDCDSKSVSESHSSWNSLCVGKKNQSIKYFPAGADLKIITKKSKDPHSTKHKSVITKGKCDGVRNYSSTPPFKIANNCNSILDAIVSQSTKTPLNIERNEVQSLVTKHSEHSDESAMKRQKRSVPVLECQQTETSNITENVSCRTESIGCVPCGTTETETALLSASKLFQVIADSVGTSTQARRQKVVDGVKDNSQSPISTPNILARQPEAELKAVLKQEESRNDMQSKRASSLQSIEDEELHTKTSPTVSVECKFPVQHDRARIFVHGDMDLRSIQSVPEANFPREIHQALARMEFKSPMRIQTYAWPAILRGQNTILVGPPQSGKTVSYIIPLVSFMLNPDLYSELRPGNGPLLLVLCSGSKSAQFVYEKCCTLLKLSNQNKVRVEIAYGGGREREMKGPLVNGCDILISTPPCFKRLMFCSHLITNVNRLAHLVLDEVDILVQKFLPELEQIITACKQMLVWRAKVDVPVQMIAVLEKWCPTVEQFLKHMSQNFVVCISGYLEVAVYSKLQPTLHYLSASSKPQMVLDILDGYQGQYKTVIICQSAAEVDELVPFLESQCFHVLMAHEDKILSHNVEICHHWKLSVVPGAHPILVCTDDVLPELDINDAMWLIHYSLPHTKTGFGFRFSCLMKNYHNMLQNPTGKEDSLRCKVHILADKDQNIRELPEVVRFLKRLSVPIAPAVEAKAVEIVHQKESDKLGFPLCYYVKAFGECLERSVCRSRHIMMDTADKPSGIPTSGEVKVKILHVHNASSFSVRLLEHTDVGGCPVPIPDEYFTVNMAVYSHFSNEHNRSLHGIPKLGDICALESKINFFQRVQVIGVVREDVKGIPEELQAKFIDEGTFTVVKVYQLLALPEKLQRLPPQVVDIFLCNVLPCDLDTSWSETASFRMNNWINSINNAEEDGKFLVGKVMLSAGYTLWLEPLECCSYLPHVGTRVKELSLSKELVKCRLAVKNPGHLSKLYELCQTAGLPIPSYEKAVPALKKVRAKTPTLKLSPPQWAHLDIEKFHQIVSYSVENPHLFFIRQYKFDDVFQRLVNELQKCVKTKSEDFHLDKGTYCLGKFPNDGQWCRARVDQLEGDCALLFFVDYGDNASVNIDDIAPITEMLIKKLPFQAIECSLAGIKSPPEGSWSEEACDMFCDFADNSHGLYIKVCEVMNIAVNTGGRKYSVVLVDVGTGTDVCLNKMLLETSLAVSDNIEQILEKLAPVHGEADGTSEENHVDPEDTQIAKLSDINISQDSTLPAAEGCIWDEEGFEFVMDDLQKFVAPRNNCKSTLPVLPSSDDHSIKGDASSCISSQSFLSDDEGNGDDTECMHPLISRTRTPQVLWYQDHCSISIKIMLVGIEKYYLGWDMMHLQFSTEINSELYEVMLDLYGPIDICSITHSAKGFFVLIKMMKIVQDSWTRLLRSQCKQPWLKADLDKCADDSDSDEDNLARHCKRALKELSSPSMESYHNTTKWKDKATSSVLPFSSSDDDDDDDDDNDNDDVMDHRGELYDPYDPLS